MASQALDGYRVIDFGAMFAGPVAGHLLADMGAEVIKVESRGKLDGTRAGRPIVGDDIAGGDRGEWPELQPVFHALNRNKLSITLNLKQPEAIVLIKELIKKSDVVLENFSPGVMDRLGLGYNDLNAIRPDLIFASMPAAGDSGPLRDIVAFAPIVGALSGFSSLIGYANERPIATLRSAIADIVAAIHAAFAITVALHHRNVTGEGQRIVLSQWQAYTSFLGESILDYTMNRVVQGPHGNIHPSMAPHNNYPCEGEDKWVSIAVRTDGEWEGLCQAMGNPPWTTDLMFADRLKRHRNSAEMDKNIGAWTRNRTPNEVMEILQAHGVAAAPVMNIEDQFLDPHFRAREIHLEREHPKLGVEWLHGVLVKLGDTPGGISRHAPLLGEHNEYVFRELLGLDAARIQKLTEEQIIH